MDTIYQKLAEMFTVAEMAVIVRALEDFQAECACINAVIPIPDSNELVITHDSETLRFVLQIAQAAYYERVLQNQRSSHALST